MGSSELAHEHEQKTWAGQVQTQVLVRNPDGLKEGNHTEATRVEIHEEI